ncbi:hypothetical protein [Neoroseomonas oryzicola]|uniref:Uncharacterized protein n=1 Tax=Neoroseomonas oryzicola TaxID=535904 RepID=A0A9X9WEB2_9PROT|nr:hypothetical protein [Neoroseomonas oryzicola]MBR0658672.1 hypothetical protein [Neoroseomonas oryzicola]NKE17892.1 hypothetical protein [Neoroseomonas oryzicola]
MRSGTLKISTLGVDVADPHRHTGAIGVQQAHVEGLTSIAANGSVEPLLAETFETTHDGSPMTTAEVLAHFERRRTRIRGGTLADALRRMRRRNTVERQPPRHGEEDRAGYARCRHRNTVRGRRKAVGAMTPVPPLRACRKAPAPFQALIMCSRIAFRLDA